MITINPHEREVVTVFKPLPDGHSVEYITCEHQQVTIQRCDSGKPYRFEWIEMPFDFDKPWLACSFRHNMDFGKKAA